MNRDLTRNPQIPPVVVHIPHASTQIPAAVRDGFLLDDGGLKRELLLMTDHFTDRLFDLPADQATCVVFPISRLVVDPERFPDDVQEAMAAKGMGVVYTKTSDGKDLRRSPSPEEREALLAEYYWPHHTCLSQTVSDVLDAHGRCLIIDAHSFPSHPLLYESDQRPDRPEICIGTDPYHTPAELSAAAYDAFLKHGFGVAMNAPFAGSMVPLDRYNMDRRVASIMVEVNRALYLDEKTGEPLPGFEAIRRRVQEALRDSFCVFDRQPDDRRTGRT